MSNFLGDILDYKRALNKKKHGVYSSIIKSLSKAGNTPYRIFKKSISSSGKINLIAEIKKASPSKGIIRENFDIAKIAKVYSENGAAAISVLTEDKYFLGAPSHIRKAADNTGVPLLAKDFFIEEGQIYEAAYNGASAVLLIAAILNDQQIMKLYNVACGLDLDCLFEVHSMEELKRILDFGAEIIGINSRDLTSFKVDLKVFEKIKNNIPEGKIIVAESGIKSRKDVLALEEMGINAILVGETFMESSDIASKIKEIMNG
ncbi:MAG: indole-3-glycerol phosphate synthase TrpC [Candidatus Omnitrophica bacterium]|nr:indole-3-glycerol phosphate synthase TrpC [Candidatus Omnitrophota bacterium]